MTAGPSTFLQKKELRRDWERLPPRLPCIATSKLRWFVGFLSILLDEQVKPSQKGADLLIYCGRSYWLTCLFRCRKR